MNKLAIDRKTSRQCMNCMAGFLNNSCITFPLKHVGNQVANLRRYLDGLRAFLTATIRGAAWAIRSEVWADTAPKSKVSAVDVDPVSLM